MSDQQGNDQRGIVVGSANAGVGLADAIAVLRNGGSAMDAAIAAVRVVRTIWKIPALGLAGFRTFSDRWNWTPR